MLIRKVAVGALLAAAVAAAVWIPRELDERAERIEAGRRLAAERCTGCHSAAPPPDVLTTRQWPQRLAFMFALMGEVSDADREAMLAYYLAQAPRHPPPRETRELPQTKVFSAGELRLPRPGEGRFADAIVTASTAERPGAVFLANVAANGIQRLDWPDTAGVAAVEDPIAMTLAGDTLWVATGQLFDDSETYKPPYTGGLVSFAVGPHGMERREEVGRFIRPVHVQVADIDRDGDVDLVVCDFGSSHLSRLVWFEALADGSWERHLVSEQGGPIRSELFDLDRDGWNDLVVLFSQGQEELRVFRNLSGRFSEEATVALLQQHPAWGYTDFSLVDFDRDGDLDLLTVNGNQDTFVEPQSPRTWSARFERALFSWRAVRWLAGLPGPKDPDYPLQAFHGIRLHRNDGENTFREAFFQPLQGAFRAVAHDFDRDGDTDIAAIAYQPDFSRRRIRSFVHFDNRGDDRFDEYGLRPAHFGRWLALAAGDVDGDGDVDLVLGANDTDVGGPFHDLWWERTGGRSTKSAVLLRNDHASGDP